MTVHVFLPEKGRYGARPAGHLSARVPIAWFLSMQDGRPLRNLVESDFDGDGRYDIGFSTGPKKFSVWLYREEGFAATPDYTRTFAESIERVAFCADLDGGGRPSLGVQTPTALYVLRPRARGNGVR